MSEKTQSIAQSSSRLTRKVFGLRGFQFGFLGGLCVSLLVAEAPAAPATPTKKEAPPKASPAEQPEGGAEEREVAADGRLRDPVFGDPPTTTDTDPDQRPSPLTPRPPEMPARPVGDALEPSELIEQLLALRARVSALLTALYESKLSISLETEGEDVRIASLVVTVDGSVVYTAPERFTGAEGLVVYEHAVAPGRHVIGVEIERFDPRAKGYRAWQATRYAVDVPEKKTLLARIQLTDDSSMQDPRRGRYVSKSSMRVEVLGP